VKEAELLCELGIRKVYTLKILWLWTTLISYYIGTKYYVTYIETVEFLSTQL
jgi:hypothetical protein